MPLLTAKPNKEDDVEVFARTPAPIVGETCSSCGSAVPARYRATSSTSGSELFFCAHHIRKFNDKLIEQKFTIYPEDISYEAGLDRN